MADTTVTMIVPLCVFPLYTACLGSAIFDLALNGGDTALAQIILDSGGNANECKYGMTPLQAAAQNGHFSFVKWLIEDAYVVPCPLALQFARKKGHLDIASYLNSRTM